PWQAVCPLWYEHARSRRCNHRSDVDIRWLGYLVNCGCERCEHWGFHRWFSACCKATSASVRYWAPSASRSLVQDLNSLDLSSLRTSHGAGSVRSWRLQARSDASTAASLPAADRTEAQGAGNPLRA